ncbi:RraA family protein [Paracoccus thiocyanatus]|uniref:Putative 4-hydroxy-4-methyl-2-oxoglutarate aldolase n=1 Tax=Paracoccus thiocyanatus TaxID=34006 RepID=A0A3D8PD77_9RHOB|nr:RraA family protein [Paracoccus thiocyanatus]RDW14036.1 hypothetical protein DIE28_04620 [Paracoccus thiocyanatus]
MSIKMDELIDAIGKGLNSAAVADALRVTGGHERVIAGTSNNIRWATTREMVVGRAHTIRMMKSDVRIPDGRQRWHEAWDAANPNDVIVVEVDPDLDISAILGDVTSHGLKRQGAAAVVTDGYVRDVGRIRKIGLPIWSRGITMRSIESDMVTTTFGEPVVCDGMPVSPGDLVIADEDGIAIVTQQQLDEVLNVVKMIAENENLTHGNLEAGQQLAEAFSWHSEMRGS